MRKRVLGVTATSSLALMSAALAQGLPNYEYSAQYQPNLAQIGVTLSLHDTVSGAGVGIAIFDGFADTTHPDLLGKITSQIIYGGNYTSFDGHGTHVSGISGASRNGSGVVGVAPGADLFNFPVFDGAGNWVAFDLAATALNSVRVLNTSGANIKSVNMSYGPVTAGDVFLNGELGLFAGYKNDFVIVRAAGNSGVNAKHETYSGTASVDLSHLLIVGSVDANNAISSFSNKPGGACISASGSCASSELLRNFFIVAPGRNIASAYPGGWVYMSGTSMAAPHVAGAVALVAADGLQKNVALTPIQIASILKLSATDLGSAGVDSVYGWGLLNVPAALSPVGDTIIPTEPTVPEVTPKPKKKPTSRRSRTKSTRQGFADPSLLSGMVVFDEFQRPFEVEALQPDSGTSAYLQGRIEAISGIVSSQNVVSLHQPGFALNAWSSNEFTADAASSLRLVSGETDLRLAFGAPNVFFGLAQTTLGGEAEPQGLDHMMFAALGDASYIFDRAVSASVKTKLSEDWDISSFVMNSFDRTAYVPGVGEPIPYYWDQSSAARGGVGFERHLGPSWTAGVAYSALYEEGTLVGAQNEGAFSLGDSAVTQSVGPTFSTRLSDKIALSGFYSWTFTEGTGDPQSIFATADNWRGSQFGLGLTASELFGTEDRLRVSLIKPLQITDGIASARVPVGREFDGTIRYEIRTAAFDSSYLPANLQVDYLTPLGPFTSVFSFEMMESNVLSMSDTDYAVTAGLAYRF